MKDHYSLTLVSKKDLINAFEVSAEDAKLVHKYRKALPVITDSEGEEGFCVDMRELHKQLKVKTEFKNWSKRKISSFNEGEDQRTILTVGKDGGKPQRDHLLTVDCAKQVAMMEKTETGKLVRKYFLLCEKIVLRMAKRNPIRVNCKESTKMMANNISGRVASNKVPAMMQDMNAFICTVSTGARPSAWKQNIGVDNVRDFLKENSKVRELRRYDEVASMAEMLSRDIMQTRETIKQQLKRTFGESEVYFNYLHKSGVKDF